MDFKSYLKTNAQKIEKELDEILSEFLREVRKTCPKLVPLIKQFINSCQGGKRIRGVLCKMGYEIAMSVSKKGSWTSQDDIIKVGAALEILHTAFLVHDDIIDQSPTRRGQLTLYKALRPKDGRVGGDHYGISQALVLGDIGLYLPTKIIAGSAFPQETKIKAIDHLSLTIINTGLGQLLDVKLHNLNIAKASQDDMQKLYLLKTALYTISGPLILGAILAGATTSLLEKLDRFGTNLGIAYQIRDDILDGEAGDQERKQLREYTTKAEKIIPDITSNAKIRKLLKDLCQYLLERSD